VEHPILTRISRDRVDHELRASKLAIEEQIGGVCRCFAYPNGAEPDISSAIAGRVQEAGYDFAFTTLGGFCSKDENRFELGRICIPGDLSPAAFHNRISGCYSFLKQYIG
jgi:peptidoglycan/xylan/chitin deacetylase (PgdA/CDA1 family)